MGWASAGRIFDPVAQALIDCGASDVIKREVLGRLVRTLQQEDWDTEDSSLQEFRDDPVIVELFHRAGVGNRDWSGAAEVVIEWCEAEERWSLECSDCGVLEVGEGTSEEHDRLVRLWSRHDQEQHDGDGIVPSEMFIHRED